MPKPDASPSRTNALHHHAPGAGNPAPEPKVRDLA